MAVLREAAIKENIPCEKEIVDFCHFLAKTDSRNI
jgi:hypothetical protein